MSILLSEIANKIGISETIQLINEKEFDCFARATTKVSGLKCVFVADKKYLKDIDSSVSMIITSSAVADELSDTEYGICIAEDVRGTYFELMSTHERAITQAGQKTIIGKNCAISSTAIIPDYGVTIGDNVIINVI